jgi:hypothetical protein
MNKIVSLHVPVQFKRRGARRLIIAPDNAKDQSLSLSCQPDPNLVNSLKRAYRWQKLIEDGRCKNIEELAKKEKVTSSFASRILRLNSLAPDIKRAILDGTQPKTLRVIDLMPAFPEEWDEQRKLFGFQ